MDHTEFNTNLFLADLFITTRGKGSVQVKKMECDICKVHTEKGDCVLHSVKVRGWTGRKLGLHLENKSQADKLLGCIFSSTFPGSPD